MAGKVTEVSTDDIYNKLVVETTCDPTAASDIEVIARGLADVTKLQESESDIIVTFKWNKSR